MVRISYIQWNDVNVRFVLDQHAEFYLFSANSLKQQFTDRHVAPLVHIILIPSQSVFALTPKCGSELISFNNAGIGVAEVFLNVTCKSLF
jgi:hypothetical protein